MNIIFFVHALVVICPLISDITTHSKIVKNKDTLMTQFRAYKKEL